MAYAVKEIYFTLQGEGAHAGRAAVFLRFAGCNLWSGREEDRMTATCSFCDTDFVGVDGVRGGKYATSADVARKVEETWLSEISDLDQQRFVVCTGGEPMLQLDVSLIDALHDLRFEVAVETNGTLEVPRAIDWICVSPKAGAVLVQRTGDELKLVHPQAGFPPEQFQDLDFRYFYLQPMDGSEQEQNIRRTMEYCRSNPRWRLSLQLHKILNIP
jgi:7-carboxy-7-deazaguanine synthase (Cx14CxxC type)